MTKPPVLNTELAAEGARLAAEIVAAGTTDAVIRALWDCAKEKQVEVCGMSWNGFNLIGDRKSVDELRRLMHEEARFKAYRQMVEAGLGP